MKKYEIVLNVFLDHGLGIWWIDWARKLKWFCTRIGGIVARERENPERSASVSSLLDDNNTRKSQGAHQ